ncbi:hypothetical protein KHF85_05640 [Xanthomonas translucens pv. graminis]|uniref:hypothetical protein n=1 Tax=Xanthomonas graminis TaxID=3390026 RepID=UPI0025416B09|nr:hypothetical protein [Xanthomonas translucens]WIH05943.1 hypothetical protein KHF85_05640 [Xanthomonas translucens pv. graminis]
MTKYSIQVNDADFPNSFPALIDGDEACELAIGPFQGKGGMEFTNIHYVNDKYPGCHHTVVYVGPNAGGAPIGSTAEDYGENWVIQVPACPSGYSLIRSYDPEQWRCGRWSTIVDAAKPAQCAVSRVEVGNPISCSGGNKIERRSDPIFAGFSLDQTFSSVNRSGSMPFGKNWSSVLSAEVLGNKERGGAVFAFLPNGSVVPFVKAEDGTWASQ